MTAQNFVFIGRTLCSDLRQQWCDHIVTCQGCHFGFRQHSAVNADIVDQPVVIRTTVATAQIEWTFRLNGTRQPILPDFPVPGLAVHVNPDAGCLLRSVIGHEDVLPRIRFQLLLRTDLNRIGRPLADNVRFNGTTGQVQVVATKAIPIVHSGQWRTTGGTFRFDPRSIRKSVAAIEVADVAQIDEVLCVTIEGFAKFSVRPFYGAV